MFQVTVCPSSGETTVFMQHLVLVIVWMTVWYAYQIDKHTRNKYTKNKLCTKLSLLTNCIYIFIFRITSRVGSIRLHYRVFGRLLQFWQQYTSPNMG